MFFSEIIPRKLYRFRCYPDLRRDNRDMLRSMCRCFAPWICFSFFFSMVFMFFTVIVKFYVFIICREQSVPEEKYTLRSSGTKAHNRAIEGIQGFAPYIHFGTGRMFSLLFAGSLFDFFRSVLPKYIHVHRR